MGHLDAAAPGAILDRHGNVAYALFSHATDSARNTTSCHLTHNDPAAPRAASLDGWSALASIDYGPTRLAPMTAPLAVDELESGVYAPGFGAVVAGRVTGAVRRVVVVRQDGVRIVATIGNGSFAAFWSSARPSPPQTVVALGEDGKVLHSERLCMPLGPLQTQQREFRACIQAKLHEAQHR